MARSSQRGAFFRRRAGAGPSVTDQAPSGAPGADGVRLPAGPRLPAAGSDPVADAVPRRDRRLSARWRRTLGLAAAAAVLALTVQSATALHLPWGRAAEVTVGLVLGVALLGLGSLVLQLLRALATELPTILGSGAAAATAGALAMLLGFASLPPIVGIALWGLWLAAFLAAGLGIAFGLRPPGSGALRTVARVAGPIVGIGVFVAVMGWWVSPGAATSVERVAGEAAPAGTAPVGNDPGSPGPYAVARFTYGSGMPARRDAYGTGAALGTTPVDLADLVPQGGTTGALRRAALGHGLDAVPRNAVVWHPEAGAGPFPLVLVAHGNANLFTPSELGYAWLGEHLASHGYVVASIDASAFNALPIVGGLRGENDARALLMLAHLQLWSELHASGHPVAATVDLGRVGLIGHSRGGEAAALAAALDRIGRLPEDALRPLSDRVGGPYGIRTVVAIAPSDGQYRPGDRPATLDGVDYLVMQGGHDADVSSFVGERQYERTHVGPAGLKAAVYLHEGNHGQFNTEWGRRDLPPPLGRLLHTAALLDGDLQRQAGRVVITAFLEASLRGSSEARQVLREPTAAPGWPAAGPVVVRYEEPGGVVLVDPSGDADPASGVLPGSVISSVGLAAWREGDPGYRQGVPREAAAVTIAWSHEATAVGEAAAAPAYRVHLPGSLLDLAPGGASAVVRLEVARATQGVAGLSAPRGPLDASLVLVDARGRSASVPLSAHGGVPADLPIRVTRFAPLAAARFTPDRYPVFATLEVPLDAFRAAAPDLELGTVHTVALVFDRVTEGILVVRSVGLAPGAGADAPQPPQAGGR